MTIAAVSDFALDRLARAPSRSPAFDWWTAIADSAIGLRASQKPNRTLGNSLRTRRSGRAFAFIDLSVLDQVRDHFYPY